MKGAAVNNKEERHTHYSVLTILDFFLDLPVFKHQILYPQPLDFVWILMMCFLWTNYNQVCVFLVK